ncbi:uncharacterized protein LOC128239781 isoform X4 [Mya arenaria]|uniref:uncharacterized protein LOC128239781 isoform X4 n=1 Tax=Mya arenaria TaxID=6604 RepID=UPI0022E258D0|nr:uncharacterized protein LOC128239781 isoform X4 [Mya arenaria]
MMSDCNMDMDSCLEVTKRQMRLLQNDFTMGVDIQTYRARIGTNKFAFGSDVLTSNISVNFSLFLKSTTVSFFLVGMCIVLWSGAYDFSLIDAVDAANEKKAEQNLELQLPSIDAVRYIPALLGPLWNCLVLKQRIAGITGAVLFIGLLLLRGGIEPNPGPIPEFPMMIGLTDKLKLTVKCGKLRKIQDACLLVDDAFVTHNREVLRVPFPVWDEYKPYSATKFGNDLKNILVKGLTQCEERRCSTVAFSAIVAGNICQELSEVYIGFGILEFLKETKGVLQEIQIVDEDEKILFDIHHCLAYMVQLNTQPPWFDISIFMTTDVATPVDASSFSAAVQATFEQLSLTERLRKKITLNEALTVDISSPDSDRGPSDMPWTLLHELLHGNWEGRDNVPDTQQDETGDWFAENDDSQAARDEQVNQCFKYMSDCQNEEELKKNKNNVASSMDDFISEKKVGIKKEFEEFLEKERHMDDVYSWKSFYSPRFENELKELKRRIVNEINKYFDEQLVKMRTCAVSSSSRNELRKKSAEIFSSSQSTSEKKAEFDKIWKDFEDNIKTQTLSMEDDSIYNDFVKQYEHKFPKYQSAYTDANMERLECDDGDESYYKRLCGINGITKADFNLSVKSHYTQFRWNKDFLHDIVHPGLNRFVWEIEGLVSSYKN